MRAEWKDEEDNVWRGIALELKKDMPDCVWVWFTEKNGKKINFNERQKKRIFKLSEILLYSQNSIKPYE